ncbi:hypothetical protein MTR_4g109630 [Medicago truncatula]|uniref:Uncharacterized protein n=1 Tax=Medicago truncatula TaxID=3880 RepID=A0A072USI2_MEDTR|nr:hypothetical protein MTR_4g109630 [Medicago truncatula]
MNSQPMMYKRLLKRSSSASSDSTLSPPGKVAGDKFGVRQQLVNFSVNESILAQYEDPLPRNDNNTFAIIDCSQISTSYYQQVIYAANYYIKSRSQWTSHYLPV